MIIFKSVLISLAGMFFLNGCSQIVALGKEQGYCEERGYDYADAGLCADPMYVYKNRKKINSQVVSCGK